MRPARGKIWIVDDEPLVARSIGRMLSRHHQVTFFSSAKEALRKIDAGEAFDLLLCDLMMPEMTGMDLLEILRARHPDRVPRMVFMTGGVFTERMRAQLETVSNPILDKPFDVKALFELISKAMESSARA